MTSFCEGFAVGHWTSPDSSTGCTVVLPPPGNVCAVDVRGQAPGSREIESLDVRRARTEVHAIVLAGASAFGLAAADGAMAWLEERGVGFKAGEATIPIVPAAIVFDAAAFPGAHRPGRDAGYAACDAARAEGIAAGRVGAGAGATVGKWAGREHFAPGGLGIAVERDDEGLEVAALAVVNAFGDVVADDGRVVAGTRAPDARFVAPAAVAGNTVLAVVAVRAGLTKPEAAFLAARGSDGITRAVRPAHTRYDGDVVFAVAAPGPAGSAALDRLGVLATRAVAAAARAAVA